MDAFLKRFGSVVERFPDKTAVSDQQRSLTYAELDADSDRLAAILHADSDGEYSSYAYLGRMTVECVTLNVAAGKAGAGLVALDGSHPDAALQEIIEHSDSVAIVTTPEFEEQAKRLTGRDPILIPTDHPVRTEIPVFKPVERDPGAVHFITYTSGSTGRPKGVPVSRRVTDLRWEQKIDFYGTTEDDICAIVNTFWWYKPLWPLAVGCEAACFDFASSGLRELDTWLREKKVTVLNTYVAMYRELGETATEPFPDLRQVILGGEAARVEDVRNFDKITVPGAELILRLACQELGPLTMFIHKHGDPVEYEKVPMGRIMRPDRVKLLDEDGKEVPEGAIGEITVSGEIVPAGYHKDPERTKEQFSQNDDGTWTFHMRDLAIRDETGMLTHMGRKDQQVKIRGYNVRPHEVEEKLLRHEGIREAAVTAIEDARGIRRLAGFYVSEGENGPSPADLREFLSKSLPNYQIPSAMVVCEALPRTPNGKLDRKALKLPEEKGEGISAVKQARTETEKVLARIWERVLGRSGFGFDDDFFDLGGDSLQAMTMLLEAEQATNSRVPLEALTLNGATLRSVVDQLEANRSVPEDYSVPIVMQRGNTSSPPIYAMHVQGGHLSDYLAMLPGMTGQTVLGIHPQGMFSSAKPGARMNELAEYCAESIQRHAPPGQAIRLMGYSFGGILGFETARVLEARGVEVSHLMLLDPPALWKQSFYNIRALKRYFTGKRTGRSLRRILESLGALVGTGPQPESLDDAHFVAISVYKPQPFAARNVLYISCRKHPSAKQYRQEWERLNSPNIETVEFASSHLGLVKPPHHLPLANCIDSWIKRTEVPEPPLAASA